MSPQPPDARQKRRLLRALRPAIVLLAALAAPSLASAHPVPFSYLDLRVSGSTIDGSLVAHIFDLGRDLRVEPAARLLDPVTASVHSEAIGRLFSSRLFIAVDGRALTVVWSGAEVIADRQSLRLRFQSTLESPPGAVSVRAVLFPYDPEHRTFLNVYEGDGLTQAILDRARSRFDYYPGTTQGRFAVVRRFLPAGVEHILIGPDHLLFLVGLLLMGGGLRRLVVIVTAFTLAHTITLSLAALNVLNPPAHVIEPMIALSIVYVGADNLLRRGGRDARAWIAFAFGFIHGFGFAYVLREMDLPARALGWSLLSFNLGVEIGQLFVVAAVASALLALRVRSEKAADRIAVFGSVVVIAAGGFWYIQLVFFPGGMS